MDSKAYKREGDIMVAAPLKRVRVVGRSSAESVTDRCFYQNARDQRSVITEAPIARLERDVWHVKSKL